MLLVHRGVDFTVTPRLSDTVRRGCTRAAGAVSKCVWQDPTGGGPPDWVLRGEIPTEAQYINQGQRGQRKRSTRLLKNCLGPTRGVVEGGRSTWVIVVRGVCASLAVVTRVIPAASVGVLSVFFREIALVGELFKR